MRHQQGRHRNVRTLLFAGLFLAFLPGCQLTLSCLPKKNGCAGGVCPHCGAPLDDGPGNRAGMPMRNGWGPSGPMDGYGQAPAGPQAQYSMRNGGDMPYMMGPQAGQMGPQGGPQRPVIPQLPPNGGTMQAGAIRPWNGDPGAGSPRNLPAGMNMADGGYNP